MCKTFFGNIPASLTRVAKGCSNMNRTRLRAGTLSCIAMLLLASTGGMRAADANVGVDRRPEARVLATEAERLALRKDFNAALKALDAACAIDPSNTAYQFQLARWLPNV